MSRWKLHEMNDILQIRKEDKGYPVYEYNVETEQDGETRYVKHVEDVWK